MTIRVRYTGDIFFLQRRGGISRYFSELMTVYAEKSAVGVTPWAPFRWSRNEYLDNLNIGCISGSIFDRRFVLSMLEKVELAKPGTERADLVHHTYYNHRPRIGARKLVPNVVTVHDMIPELYMAGPPLPVVAKKRRAVERADGVAVVSTSTLKDFRRVFPSYLGPVAVTPLAASPLFAAARSGSGMIGGQFAQDLGPYVLYVGVRTGYKDFRTLLQALFLMIRNGGNAKVLCVGGGEFSESERDLVSELRLEGKVRQVSLSDPELQQAYEHCAVFAFTSRVEGFGLPVLEAMSAGAPVVAADCAASIEVGGDASLHFRSGDAVDLAEKLALVIEDPRRQVEMRAAGKRRVSQFSWTATASATAALYEQVLNGHG